jgi:hypothetical protein
VSPCSTDRDHHAALGDHQPVLDTLCGFVRDGTIGVTVERPAAPRPTRAPAVGVSRSPNVVSLAPAVEGPHAATMFVISAAEVATIRAAFDHGGEFLAVIELRRLFPGIRDNDQARDCARTIAGWMPPPKPPKKLRICPSRTKS